MYFVLSAFTSSPICLVATTKASYIYKHYMPDVAESYFYDPEMEDIPSLNHHFHSVTYLSYYYCTLCTFCLCYCVMNMFLIRSIHFFIH